MLYQCWLDYNLVAEVLFYSLGTDVELVLVYMSSLCYSSLQSIIVWPFLGLQTPTAHAVQDSPLMASMVLDGVRIQQTIYMKSTASKNSSL